MDIPEPTRMRMIIEMLKMRDRHVREIRKLLEVEHHVAAQIEWQLRTSARAS